MTLYVPTCISDAGLSDAPVQHSWDDADPSFVYARMDERLQHRIAASSDRGVLALSAGFAEWIAWRMIRVSDDPLLFQKIEAVYAGIVDWRYLRPTTLPDRQGYEGPIRGPLWAAANLLDYMISLIRRRQFAEPESVSMSYLVLHVLPDPKPFKEWRRFAIRRIAALYPANSESPLGVPVPREALDPNVDYTLELATELLSKYLATLDPARNPYLRSGDEMIAAGFEGTPYSLK